MSDVACQIEAVRGLRMKHTVWGSPSKFAIPAITVSSYFVGSLAGFAMQLPAAPHSGQIGIVRPPNAVLVSLPLSLPMARWPSVLLAALPAHLPSQWMRGTLPSRMAIRFGHNRMLASLATLGVRRFSSPKPVSFLQLRNVIVFGGLLVLTWIVFKPFQSLRSSD